MTCLRSGEQFRLDEMVPSSKSLAAKDYSTSVYSSAAGEIEIEQKPDIGNIEEAESSLRESLSLNYEEARGLLGRFQYQKGNIEAALRVFEGIDISAITPQMKVTLGRKGEPQKRRSHNFATLSISIHTVSLLLEAIFLKAKSLQGLERYKDKILEHAAKLVKQETLNNSVELPPELWKLADSPHQAIFSYRRALLDH